MIAEGHTRSVQISSSKTLGNIFIGELSVPQIYQKSRTSTSTDLVRTVVQIK